MTKRYFVQFENVENKHLTLLEAYPSADIATPENFLVLNMPEDQTEIKILGKSEKLKDESFA